MYAQITPFGVASAATSATTFSEHIGGSARVIRGLIDHSAHHSDKGQEDRYYSCCFTLSVD
jgi:hypothetical protein